MVQLSLSYSKGVCMPSAQIPKVVDMIHRLECMRTCILRKHNKINRNHYIKVGQVNREIKVPQDKAQDSYCTHTQDRGAACWHVEAFYKMLNWNYSSSAKTCCKPFFPCVYSLNICQFICALLSWFRGLCSPGALCPFLLPSSFCILFGGPWAPREGF